jgi:hypothetical protein
MFEFFQPTLYVRGSFGRDGERGMRLKMPRNLSVDYLFPGLSRRGMSLLFHSPETGQTTKWFRFIAVRNLW